MAVVTDAGIADSVSFERSDEYETLIIEACGALAEVDGSRFHVSGFGSGEWSLDVAYDLSAFMEQLPSLLAGVRGRREVEVDLYSQGVERSLTFSPKADSIFIRCESRTDWVPNPKFETIGRDDLLAMLSALASDFLEGIKLISPELAESEQFRVLAEK